MIGSNTSNKKEKGSHISSRNTRSSSRSSSKKNSVTRKIPIPRSFGLGDVIEEKETTSSSQRDGNGNGDNNDSRIQKKVNEEVKEELKEEAVKEEVKEEAIKEEVKEEAMVSWDECMRLDGAMQCWFVTHRNSSVGMTISTCQRILSKQYFIWFLQRMVPTLYVVNDTNHKPVLVCQPMTSTVARLSTLKKCHRQTKNNNNSATSTTVNFYDPDSWIQSCRDTQTNKRKNNLHPESSNYVSQTMPWLHSSTFMATLPDDNNNTDDNNNNNKNINKNNTGMTLQERVAAREQERNQYNHTADDDNIDDDNNKEEDVSSSLVTGEDESLSLWRIADILQAHVQRTSRRMYHNHKTNNNNNNIPRIPLPDHFWDSYSLQIQKIQESIPNWIQINNNDDNNQNHNPNISRVTIPILTNAIYSQTIRIHLIPKSSHKQPPLPQNSHNIKTNAKNTNKTTDSIESKPTTKKEEESTKVVITTTNNTNNKKRKRGNKLSLTNRLVETNFPNHKEQQINKKKRPLEQLSSSQVLSTSSPLNKNKKTKVLRVNPYLHLTEADVDGGIALSNISTDNMNTSTTAKTPRGLKRLFYQMNAGQRI